MKCPRSTAIKWQGNFSNPGLGTPNPTFIPHHSSIHYRIDHPCTSIPEEAGQPTKLRPLKLRCPEPKST